MCVCEGVIYDVALCVCVCVCMYVCVCACENESTDASTHTDNANITTLPLSHFCMYAHVCVYVCVCVCIYSHTYIHTYIHTYLPPHVLFLLFTQLFGLFEFLHLGVGEVVIKGFLLSPCLEGDGRLCGCVGVCIRPIIFFCVCICMCV